MPKYMFSKCVMYFFIIIFLNLCVFIVDKHDFFTYNVNITKFEAFIVKKLGKNTKITD